MFVSLEFTGIQAAGAQGFSGRDFSIDNINVTEAPEPGTWLMLGSGLALLSRRLRRRRS